MPSHRSSSKEASLRVSDSRRRDAGRGYARIDPFIQKELGLHAGDGIELKNPVSGKKTAALVMHGYPEDTGTGIIRIDGFIRSNLKASIDERVIIRKIHVEPADEITFAPLNKKIGVRNAEVFAKILDNRVVMVNDIVSCVLYSGTIHFMVKSFHPKEKAVQIHRNTKIDIARQVTDLKSAERQIPRTTYEDLGGLGDIIQKVREMIELPMRHPEIFNRLGIQPPKGLLLYGAPGTGKTMLARAVANETDAHFITLSGPEVMSKFYGQSEENLRKVFKEAEDNAPSIIFIDEIDSIASKRQESQGEVERRVVAQLLSLMDGLDTRGNVVVIGATNRENALDPALRRPGRFDREIEIGVPTCLGRLEILQIHSRGMPMEDVNLNYLAEKTYGFVGADLQALAKEAGMIALRRILPEINLEEEVIPLEVLEKLKIFQADFDQALAGIDPSALREVLITTPSETWMDVGGLDEAKTRLQEAVEWPLKFPNIYKHLRAHSPKGILLFGLPGTGKTLLAKALAHETEINFISVKGPEFLSKWVGESEKAVRETFRKARAAAPCIIFFDEIDAIAGVRGRFAGSQVTEQVVSQLLTEMDGLEGLKDVILLAATNRPDMLDPALLRSGRFGRHIEIPIPDKDVRIEIFKIHLQNKPLANDVNIDQMAQEIEGYTGADIQAICEDATLLTIRKAVTNKKIDTQNADSVKVIKISKEELTESIEKILKSADKAKKSHEVYAKEPSEGLYR